MFGLDRDLYCVGVIMYLGIQNQTVLIIIYLLRIITITVSYQ